MGSDVYWCMFFLSRQLLLNVGVVVSTVGPIVFGFGVATLPAYPTPFVGGCRAGARRLWLSWSGL